MPLDNDMRTTANAKANMSAGFVFANGGTNAFVGDYKFGLWDAYRGDCADIVGKTVVGDIYFKTADVSSGFIPAIPISGGNLVLDVNFNFKNATNEIIAVTAASAITIPVTDAILNDIVVPISFVVPALPATDSNGFTTTGIFLDDVTVTINGGTTAQGEALGTIFLSLAP